MKPKNVLKAWSLFIDRKILQQIKECTETVVKCVLQFDNLTVMIDEFQAFIGISYVRGESDSECIDVHSL